MSSPVPSPSVPMSIDRVRVIRRSIRCFILGSIGAVPLLGLPTGYLAMRVQRQIAAELRETWDFKPLHLFWAISMFVMAIFGFAGFPLLATALAVVTFIAHFFVVRWVASRIVPGEWNPGSNLVYWGVTLAYLGRAFTVSCLVLLFAVILDITIH